MKIRDEYFRTLVEEIEDYSIFSMDLNGNIRDWNKGAERIKGYKEEEVVGKNFRIFYTKGDLEKGVPDEILKKAIQEGRSISDGWQLKKDGSRFWAHVVITAIRKDDKVIGLIKVTVDSGSDYTPAVKMDFTESRLLSLIENSNDAIALCDENFKVIFQSQAANRITGYTLRERERVSLDKIFDEKELKRLQQIREEVMRTNQVPVPFQTRYLRRDGQHIWIDGTMTNFLTDPILNAIVVNYRDFTEYKKAEYGIRNSEERLRTINANLPESAVYQVMAIPDGSRKFVYISENIEKLLEVSATAALEDASALYKLFPPEVVTSLGLAEQRAISKMIPFKEELPMILPSGKYKWFSFSSAPRKLSDDSIIWDGVITDISDYKKTELALRESEFRFKQLAESLPQMVWTFDAEGECDYLSTSWIEYTGVPLGEQLGFGWLKQIHPGDRKMVMQTWEESLDCGCDFRMEFRLKRADKSFRRFETHVTRLVNTEGKTIKWIGSNTDIEDRKKEDEKQNLLATIITTTNDAIISTTSKGIITSWNPGAEILFGYFVDEALDHSIETLIPSDDSYKENIKKKIKQGLSCQYESAWIRKDEKLVNISLTISPIKDVKNNVVGISHIVRDISDRKKAELVIQNAEKRYQNTLDSMMEGCWMIGFDWRILYLNHAAAMDGRSTIEKLQGKTLMEAYPGIEHTPLFETFQLCMDQRQVDKIETDFKFPDGSTGWFDLKIQPSSEGLFILTAEITNRKKAELEISKLSAAVLKSEEQFRALVENSNDVFIVLQNGEATFVSSSIKRVLGFTQEEFLRYDQNDMVHPDDYNRVFDLVTNFKDVIALEYRNMHKDGTWHWIEGTAMNLEHIKGIEGILFTIRDITARKKSEEELLDLNHQILELNVGLEQMVEDRTNQLQVANHELEAFSYSVSHDLRAPLRAINGYAKMIEEDYGEHFDENGIRLLSIIRQNARKMGVLIDELLSFSRLGKKEVQRTPIPMEELITEVVNEVQSNEDHSSHFVIESICPAVADRTLIRQVWFNLIMNAAKYSSKESKPEIRIGSSKEGSEIVYYVRDNGCGFNMDFAHKLFGVFQRLHDAEEFEGTGVGLAIVKRIVDKHKGRVWAEGKVGSGATFYFSLPVYDEQTLSHSIEYSNVENKGH